MATEIKIEGLREIDTDGRDDIKRPERIEHGPMYNVPLIKTLPIRGLGMRQAMASRHDLMHAMEDADNHRLCAAYEIALNELDRHIEMAKAVQSFPDLYRCTEGCGRSWVPARNDSTEDCPFCERDAALTERLEVFYASNAMPLEQADLLALSMTTAEYVNTRYVTVERHNEYVGKLEAELAEVREVVEKLPVTADGVPMTPRMEVYGVFTSGADLNHGGPVPRGLQTIESVRFNSVYVEADDLNFSGLCFYSTREAADAATTAINGDPANER